jgi:hypothetical protein
VHDITIHQVTDAFKNSGLTAQQRSLSRNARSRKICSSAAPQIVGSSHTTSNWERARRSGFQTSSSHTVQRNQPNLQRLGQKMIPMSCWTNMLNNTGHYNGLSPSRTGRDKQLVRGKWTSRGGGLKRTVRSWQSELRDIRFYPLEVDYSLFFCLR